MAIKLENISKKYGSKVIFKDFNLHIEKGEFVAIRGESGRGKTTLLNLIAGLDIPDEGKVIINDVEDCYKNKKDKMNLYRKTIGFLFQNFALVDNETVEDNLKLAMKYENDKDDSDKRIDEALVKLGLLEKKFEKVYKLSGGEQQRVALARIMIKTNEIILADEPTGSLDEKNKLEVLKVLKEFNEKGKTVVVVTHDEEVSNYCTRTIYL